LTDAEVPAVNDTENKSPSPNDRPDTSSTPNDKQMRLIGNPICAAARTGAGNDQLIWAFFVC